jgi:hypothetical protein
MSLILGLLANNWKTVAIGGAFLALLLSLWGSTEVARHYKSEAAAAKLELSERIDADKAQEAENERQAQEHAKTDANIAAQLGSALAAAHITGAALTSSVLKYEAAGRGSVSCGAGAGGAAGHLSGGSSAGGDRRIDQSLSVIPADAQVVVDQLRACQAALKGMSGH